MLTKTGLIRRLLGDRRAVAAAVIAVSLPAIILVTAAAADAGLTQIRVSQLQSAADAGANAGREALIAANPGNQSLATTTAQTYANANMPSSLAAADVVQGWWYIEKAPDDPTRFGPPVPGQTGALFSNAVRVTTRMSYRPVFRQLLGNDPMKISRWSTGYKCSNTDYPLTLIPDDASPPTKPTVWLSWATPGNAASTSYYFANPSGRTNPVIKFYSPTAGEDVSFVITFSNGTQLQMDTYCKGTYLIVPDAFDWKNVKNITATVLRGDTNNSFHLYADQSKYPTVFASGANSYNPNGTATKLLDALRPAVVKVTPYPSANGTQYWASEGNPTPDRRTVMVH
ncbi:hypothetical protein KX816_11760 [Sphingosinicellaceae bacterium]|nr:hypothetical protein KX816_11760 [Sphingosinicellaceae bacterium]